MIRRGGFHSKTSEALTSFSSSFFFCAKSRGNGALIVAPCADNVASCAASSSGVVHGLEGATVRVHGLDGVVNVTEDDAVTVGVHGREGVVSVTEKRCCNRRSAWA